MQANCFCEKCVHCFDFDEFATGSNGPLNCTSRKTSLCFHNFSTCSSSYIWKGTVKEFAAPNHSNSMCTCTCRLVQPFLSRRLFLTICLLLFYKQILNRQDLITHLFIFFPLVKWILTSLTNHLFIYRYIDNSLGLTNTNNLFNIGVRLVKDLAWQIAFVDLATMVPISSDCHDNRTQTPPK